MTNDSERYILNLRNYIFRAPSTLFTLSATLVIIFIAGYLFTASIFTAFHIFLLPFIIVNALDYLSIKISRIYFPFRRITSLNFLSFFIALIQIAFLQFFYNFYFSFFLGFAWVIYLRVLVYRTFLSRVKPLDILTSLYYSIILAIFAFIFHPSYLTPFLLSTAIYALAAQVFIHSSISRFIREYSEDPLWFVSSFINYLASSTTRHRDSLNMFFDSIYTRRKVPVTTMVFRAKDDSMKAAFVFPYVHPGPFGDVGGSNLPNKLEKYTDCDKLFVFHTATTHDNNIATEEDVKKIANCIKNSFSKNSDDAKCSCYRRFEIHDVAVGVQVINDCAMVHLLPVKRVFDDVDLDAALELRKLLLTRFKEVCVVDAHNNFDENAVPLTMGSRELRAILDKVSIETAKHPLRMGVAFKRFEGKSIGPGGVRVAVLECGDKKCAYILFDGNNIRSGLRDKIRNSLHDLVDDAEIFSTDNHIVNISMIDLNPVGDKDEWDELVKIARNAVKEALKNIEEVKVAYHTEFAELKMARRGQLKKMTEITRWSMGRAKVLAPLTLGTAFVLSLLIFWIWLIWR